MGFVYDRTIRFSDTDAAGVVYFANLMSICHEAYEASLVAAGVDIQEFFRGESVAVPIVHSSMDFRRPLRCGEAVQVELTVAVLGASGFEITYQLTLEGTSVAWGQTRHLCIDSKERVKLPFPLHLNLWLHFHDAVR
jgi:1,4-dihydroxy-2-naphthoyl-CoA hydrolase